MLALLPFIFLLIAAGILAGRWAGRSRLWLAAFLFSLALVALVIVGHRSLALSFVAPFSWAIHPFVSPLLMGLAISLMLMTLMARVPAPRQRWSVGALMAAMLAYYALMPAVLPALARVSLAMTPTRIDPQRICLQTKLYTCGPASAVTCLKMLDIEANEGALAIDAYAAPALGTNPTLLADAVNRLAHPRDVHCEYRLIESLDKLPTPCIANLFSANYGGHYVAVLKVTPERVLVGDPMLGRGEWTREEFLSQWIGAAHVFTPQARSTGFSPK